MTLNADASDETREAAGWRSGTERASRDTGLGGDAGETKADSAAASRGHQPLAGGPGRRRGADEPRAAAGPTFRPRADWRRRRGAGPEATGGAGPVRRLRSTGPPRAGGWAERAPRAGAGERGEGAERAAKPARARLGAEGGGPRAGTAAASGGGSGGGSRGGGGERGSGRQRRRRVEEPGAMERKRWECPALPQGWEREEVPRRSGLSAGHRDVFYYR